MRRAGRRARRPRQHGRALAAAAVVGLVAAALVATAAVTLPRAAAALTDRTTRLSVTSGGGQGNGDSFGPSLSADGRFAAFSSLADNLGPPDQQQPSGDGTRPDSDVFVHDRQAGPTTRLSLAADGTERNADSFSAAISADGHQVAFVSDAQLDPADTDGRSDVYARGVTATGRAGGLALVSTPDTVARIGFDSPSVSGDGRRVGYDADTGQPTAGLGVAPDSVFLPGRSQVAVKLVAIGGSPSHLTSAVIERPDEPPVTDITVDTSDCPAGGIPPGEACDLILSTDAINSPPPAELIVDDDGTNSPHHVLVNVSDLRSSGSTSDRPAAAAAPGSALVEPAPANIGPLAPDGSSTATITFSQPPGAPPASIFTLHLAGSVRIERNGCVGSDGAGSLPCQVDVRLTAAGPGGPAPGPWSGAVTAFYQINDPDTGGGGTVTAVVYAQEAVSTVLVADRDADQNGILDEAGGLTTVGVPAPGGRFAPAEAPSLSADGRFLAFVTTSPLARADTNDLDDVYRVALDANGDGRIGDFGPPELVSVATVGETAGRAANGFSVEPSISADGHAVAFASAADDLVAADGNGQTDVFVRDLTAGRTVRASVTGAGAEAAGRSLSPALSADARTVAFATDAPNLGASGRDDDGNESNDTEVVLRDLVAGRTERISVATGDATPPGTNGDHPTISADGRYVGFDAPVPLVGDDTNGATDVYLRDRRPVARLLPNPLDFGDQPLGRTSGALPLQISNAGTGPLLVGTLAVTGPDAAAVTVTNPCVEVVLFAGEACPAPAQVRVTPTHPGRLQATVTLSSSADPVAVQVVANGAVAGLLATPSPLDLGARPVRTLGPPVPLTLTNNGTVPVRITAYRLDGPAVADVTPVPAAVPGCAGPDGCPGAAVRCPAAGGTLAGGARCLLAFTFRPGAVGPRTAALHVDAVGVGTPVTAPPPGGGDAPAEPVPPVPPAGPPPPAGTLPPDQPFTLDVPLSGVGLAGALTAAPNPARFGTPPVGRAGLPVTVTVTDAGPGPVRLGTPTLAGPDPSRYTVDSRDCAGRTLPAGGSCRLVLRLTPDRVGGPISATVLVPSVDIPVPLVVRLLGAGAGAVLELDPVVGPPGTVVQVTGTGFPPGGVQLSWDPGLGGDDTTASGTGTLSDQVLVLPRDQLGARDLVAVGLDGVRLSQPFLVVPPEAAPPRLINTG